MPLLEARRRSRCKHREREPLRLETWLPIYDRVCEDFQFDKEHDLGSARLLLSMIGDKGKKGLAAVRRDFPRTVLVCGGGPNLADEISSLAIEWPVVAADGATTVLLEADIALHMIVTDLDGVVEDQIEANERGATTFVHAHGDNETVVRRYVGKFQGVVVGTCQCVPPPGLFNFGGFTDGDRAACICSELGARTIRLAGFDFENPTEKTGKSKETKKRKLKWAKVILRELASEGVTLLNANGENIKL